MKEMYINLCEKSTTNKCRNPNRPLCLRYTGACVQMQHEIDSLTLQTSVADPWHFGVDLDLDPRIHAFD